MAKVQSPCIGVCKFRRPGPAGTHCIGCSMTREQKKIAKTLKKGAAAEAFVALVIAQQSVMGGYRHWRAAYLKRSLKKGRRVAEVVRGAG
ncbi:DUF1289 domain-containing protein [Wenxinia marina]|uniref:DUF1289 domain-containing protein n=1 Tax=Wenxinia marina DSM 24838 TaxID=1123501 RepID=A0A0D0Q728_9RHOB|nr:DUF1289 domain-containing protein [Wenxinia marina]KIQ68247.1 hypothetical protein Wenmar_03257 [Wenxinia marina DSM 24838]GGL77070.1 hypothetical protein GCM10011392_34420 [Wenxinia marina]